MNLSEFQEIYARHPRMEELAGWARSSKPNVRLGGLSGSSFALAAASLFKAMPHHLLLIEDDSERAAYLYNDLKHLFAPDEVFYFPSSYKRAIKLSQLDAANEILRTEVLNRLSSNERPCIVVSSPEAVMQKVVASTEIKKQMLQLKVGESVSIDFIAETLAEYGFQRVDFVYEPGQFSVRGGIVDVFSYSYELPFRCDFFGDEIESIRIFDIETQLSQEQLKEVSIIPDLKRSKPSSFVSFFQFIRPDTWVGYANYDFTADRIDALEKSFGEKVVPISALEKKGIDELRSLIVKTAPEAFEDGPMLRDLVKEGDTVVLCVPIDTAAPKGRIILPQVHAIRDILDANAKAVVVKENQLAEQLDNLKEPPALVVTDSQVFAKADRAVPKEIPLTSFSILMARQKGNLSGLAAGAKAVENLKPGDKVLIAEACTHVCQAEDIGRVKIPAWLNKKVGGELNYEWYTGDSFPEDVSSYKLVIHCGACMINRRAMLSRQKKCAETGVSIVNYGVLISYLHGIMDRAMSPMKDN